MKEMEKEVMCVLLKQLMNKNLITPDVHDRARERILDTLDSPGFFCYAEEDRKEETDGYTQNSGRNAYGRAFF